MTNLQTIDFHDVELYWKSRNLVDDRHLQYYVRWLQRFLTGPGSDARLCPEDAQRAFVEQLERDQVPEWEPSGSLAVNFTGSARSDHVQILIHPPTNRIRSREQTKPVC